MQNLEIKQCLLGCPDMAYLDEGTVTALLERGEAETVGQGVVIYAEGSKLDGTFCLLLSGDLVVQKAGEIIGGIFENEIFGEMAYFSDCQVRTATVYVGSPQATILKFRMAPGELTFPGFAGLRKSLGLQTWRKFVNTWQSFTPAAA